MGRDGFTIRRQPVIRVSVPTDPSIGGERSCGVSMSMDRDGFATKRQPVMRVAATTEQTSTFSLCYI